MSKLPLAAVCGKTEPVGYLVFTSEHHSVSPNEASDGTPRQEFWCVTCASPCDGSPVPKHSIRVARVNIGIYSQVCDVCGRLVVDGVKTAYNDKTPLCLFGRTAGQGGAA